MAGLVHANREFKILVAEDDPEDQILTSDALDVESDETMHVDFVLDGEELLAHLHAQLDHSNTDRVGLPDLIVVDLFMPGMGGFDALRAIKSNPEFRSIPVIIMSVSDAPGDVLAAYDRGAAGFITKPPTYEELRTKLQILWRYWTEVMILADRENKPAPVIAGETHELAQTG